MVAIRWFHALAAMAWVGGGAFYLLVLRPASRRLSTGNPDADRTIAEEFKGVVNTAIAVLIVSGVVLSLSRLTSDAVSLPYIAVLAGKVTLAMYMFYIIWSMQRRRGLRGQTADEQAAEGFLAYLALPFDWDHVSLCVRRGGVWLGRRVGCVV